MTNADKIRSMSDEKLAAWLWNRVGFTTYCNEMCPFMKKEGRFLDAN